MATWLNHVALTGPRNGTTTHTVDPSTGTVVAGSTFTPTAGRLLVVLAYGAVTSTTPAGWTLPTNGSAVNSGGLYVWTRTAAGSDTFSTTHNGSNYAVSFDIYEFAAGSTFVSCASATGVAVTGGAGPTLSGLTGTNWIAGAVGQVNNTVSTYTTSWSTGVEAADSSVAQAVTDGYNYGLTYLEDSVLTSASAAATTTFGAGPTVERLMFAVNVSGAGGGTQRSILTMPTRRAY